MVLPLLVSLAFAAESPDWRDSDIVVTAHVDATPAQLFVYMQDLQHHRDLWGEPCATDWVFGEVTVGLGASAQVQYNAAGMRRELVATLARVTDNRRVDIEHAGKKGFVTTWRFVEEEGGSEVELHTWLNPPPWPFRKYYANKVQPAWQVCHQQALDNLRKKAREL